MGKKITYQDIVNWMSGLADEETARAIAEQRKDPNSDVSQLLAWRKNPNQSPSPVLDARPAKLLKSFEHLSYIMDSIVLIPGTKIAVGLDAVLGLVPGIGDVGSAVVQIGITLKIISEFDLPKKLARKMVLNTLVDCIVGSVPLAGDVFDVFFRSYARNLRLLKQHLKDTGIVIPETPISPPATTSRTRRP
jgi:Domain of unknown function (DUF4112)